MENLFFYFQLSTLNSKLIDVKSGMCTIIGILNVTPDSYFDGGKFNTIDAAVTRANEMIAQGADVIEIGGESTGPGSKDVTVDDETQRVMPTLDAIRASLPDAKLAIDTYKADIADEALKRGAMMINDVTAGRGDEKMFSVIAKHECQYVMMFSKDIARTKVEAVQYDDVIRTIRDFLSKRMDAANTAGIAQEKIVIDPGLGHFVSSDPKYSWEILRKLERFADMAPVYVSPSRKSFTAGPNNLPTTERLAGTLAATAIAIEHGARFIRTHDVAETRKVIDVLR